MADVYVEIGKMQVLAGKNVAKDSSKGVDKVMKAAATKAVDKAAGYTTSGSGTAKYTLRGLLVALKVDAAKKKTTCEVDLAVYTGPKKLGQTRKPAAVAGVGKPNLTKCIGKAMASAVSDATGLMKASSSGVVGIVLTVSAKGSKPLPEAATQARMTKVAKAAIGKLSGRAVVTKSAKYRLTLLLKKVTIDKKAPSTGCEVKAGIGPPDAVPKKTLTKSVTFKGVASARDAVAAVDMCVKDAISAAKPHLK